MWRVNGEIFERKEAQLTMKAEVCTSVGFECLILASFASGKSLPYEEGINDHEFQILLYYFTIIIFRYLLRRFCNCYVFTFKFSHLFKTNIEI